MNNILEKIASYFSVSVNEVVVRDTAAWFPGAVRACTVYINGKDYDVFFDANYNVSWAGLSE